MLAWKLGTAAAAAALLAVTAARADDAPRAIVVGTGHAESTPGEAHTVLPKRSEFWLGVYVSRPSPALQAQLKLPKHQGLLVEELRPESPAAKAGVRQYDILLAGNDKPLSGLHDLVLLIDQVKDGKLTLDLLRAGQHETVTVTPTKRPAHEPGEIGGPWLSNPEDAGFGRGFPWADPHLAEGRPWEFHIVRPGQILPPGGPMTGLAGGGSTTMEIIVHATSSLSDGSKVEITRHGAEPAKVVVTHDKEKWEGAAGDLSKIPEKIRPEVEKLLHPAFDHLRVSATSGGPASGDMMTYFGGAGLPPNGPFKVLPDVEKRLAELQKQVDELRKKLEALQSKTQNRDPLDPREIYDPVPLPARPK
jgi:hypothetical protein